MSKVDVFFHGRPQGQKFWPKGDIMKEDSLYLEPFLDSRIGADVSCAMIIDYVKCNSYYSFIVRKNIIEKERGTDAYFAITLKIEKSICKNVSKLYQLLSLVYAEKCENALFTKENNGMLRFRINSFDEIDGVLSDAKNVLISNFEKVISQYVVQLTASLGTSHSNEITRYSLKETDSAIFFEDCSTCKVVVSADYPRRDISLQQEIKKLEQEKTRIREESEKKTSLLHNQLSDKQSELDRAVLQGNLLNVRVTDLQSKLNSLKNAEEDIRKYKKEAEDYKNKYNNKKKEFDKAAQEVDNLRQQLRKKSNASNERPLDTLRPMAGRFQGDSEIGYASCPKYYQNDSKKVWAKGIVAIAWSLLFIIAVIAATFSILTYRHSAVSPTKEDMQELKENVQNPENPIQKTETHSSIRLEHGEVGFKINIAGNPSEWKVGKTAELTLKKDNNPINDVEWEVSENATIDPNNKDVVRFTEKGAVSVRAIISGVEADTIIQRNFEVK